MNDRRLQVTAAESVRRRLTHGLIPAVPVPFRGRTLDRDALAAYAQWMALHPVAGVAVNVHTGRGRQLSEETRRQVLGTWRAALPDRVLVAGAWNVASAAEARELGADAVLAFAPSGQDPLAYHVELARELPVIAFYLYQAAGGTDYDDATLREVLAAPGVVGIKVATLDSVMTFQRIAALCRSLPDTLLITGEDRFLGYSLLLGARSALIGMGSALTDLQAGLLRAHAAEDWPRFVWLSDACDRFGAATFTPPMEGYVRRMLWAAAADGGLPGDACDDPWGPSLPPAERDAVVRAVRDARAVGG
ncbi:MAG TPA: dihydrodipicolinate synthase family protein [Gemmatimonadales bacterium]|jgi:4-hydroxy-tetrahydrodipicolinate synthase|nr:dihydrodipicolinate synthase family protein [Gemmatimonadales bacterium]